MAWLLNLIITSLRTTTPILLAAMGGLLCAQVNMFNIALEGKMLMGAFFGVVGGYLWGSWVFGVLLGVASGLIFALIFALFVVEIESHPITIGIVLNLLALALTTVLLEPIFGGRGFFLLDIPLIPVLRIPGMEGLGRAADIINNQNFLYYLAYAGIFFLHYFLYYTAAGLRLRAVGLKPLAAMTLGLRPKIYRYLAILISGALCGAAGVWLSLSSLGMFSDNMSAGRGFIALAAVLFGQARPLWVLLASFIFGLARAVAIQLQGRGIPSELVLMMPYLITIISLWLATKRMKRTQE